MAAHANNSELLLIGRLEIRPQEGLAVIDGHVLMLTARELELFAALARNAGRVVSREQLFGAVWGRSLPAGDRSVDVYVRKLRVKLEAALPQATLVHTHFGFGYRLDPVPLQAGYTNVTDE